MKQKVLIGAILCGGFCLLIFISIYQNKTAGLILNADSVLKNNEEQSAEKIIAEEVSSTPFNGRTMQMVKPSSAPALSKKNFDDGWCNANTELSPNDVLLAENQVEDWNEYQGRARAKSHGSIDLDDESYPNNSFVTSYQELPIEQLKLLAAGDDKWAMVTLLQSAYGDAKLKDEVANKLLVQGASYYALEYLVIKTLSTAKTNYRRTGDVKEASEHLINALVYAQWGVEHYNIGGLTPYLAITSRDPFEGGIEPNALLVNANKEVKQRYKEFSTWIDDEQLKLGITVQNPPKAAINEFAGSVAILRNMHPNRMAFISEMRVTESDRFNTTPCVEVVEARLAERQR